MDGYSETFRNLIFEDCLSVYAPCMHAPPTLCTIIAQIIAHPRASSAQRATMEYETYAFKSMVRGYHVYQEVWVAAVGEEFSCARKLRITEVLFFCRRSKVWCNSRSRSYQERYRPTCSLFLRQGGMIIDSRYDRLDVWT